MARKLKCNDEVIVLSGKDKGKRGKIKFVFSDKKKVLVSGVNLIKKHQKPIPDKNKPGGILTKESPVDLSNVAIFNVNLNKPDRIGFTIQSGKKKRIFKSSGIVIK